MRIALAMLWAVWLDTWPGEPKRGHPLVRFGLPADEAQRTLLARALASISIT